jgi:ABC-type spermidine/putrescine transport system permease subunit II
MTTVTDAPSRRLDFTRPVLWLFAATMIVLIVLPLSWLMVFAFTDKARNPTLQNFVALFTDPAFLDPLWTTATIATTSAVACCIVAAPIGWLVSRTDMPGRQIIRALVTASFVTPPFLGAVAWELLAAPNSGMLNQLYRYLTGAEDPLFDIYSLTGLIFVISCYTFPFVFVLVANALDNMPGELEDASSILGGKAWTTARRVTIPLALPALVAGALIAFLQAMTLFGSPAILALPAGFHTMTTKIWSLFQYPPKLELAAAAAVPLLVLTILLLQGQKFLLGRRGFSVVGGKYGPPRPVEMGAWRWAALAFCLMVLLNPVFLPYFALLNAAFSPNATTLVTPSTATLHNIVFVFTEHVLDPVGAEEHRDPRRLDGDRRHDPRAGRRLRHDAARDRQPPPAGLSRHRADRRARHRARGRLVPELHAATLRALRHAVDSAAGVSHYQPAVGLSAIAGGILNHSPRAGRRQPHPRRHALAVAVADHRAAAAHRRDRDLVLHLHRRDAGIVRGDRAVHLADQGAVGPDLRPQRKRRPRRDFGARHCDAGDHLCRGAGGKPHPDVRRRRGREVKE